MYSSEVDESVIAVSPGLMRKLRLLEDDMIWVYFNGKRRVFLVKRFDGGDLSVSLARPALDKLSANYGDIVSILPCRDNLNVGFIYHLPELVANCV